MTDTFLIVSLLIALLSGVLIGGLLVIFRINPPEDDYTWLQDRNSKS